MEKVTNFSHLKRWKRMYDSALEMEDALLEATTILKYKKAIGASRDVLEHMTKELVRGAGMTDQDVLQAMAADGKAAKYPTNYGRILAIKRIGLFSPESINNIFFLNKKGNAGNHTDSELDTLELGAIKLLAEQVYAALYRETYLFAHQYMPILEAQRQKGIKMVKPVQDTGWIVAGVVIGVALLMAMVVCFSVFVFG